MEIRFRASSVRIGSETSQDHSERRERVKDLRKRAILSLLVAEEISHEGNRRPDRATRTSPLNLEAKNCRKLHERYSNKWLALLAGVRFAIGRPFRSASARLFFN